MTMKLNEILKSSCQCVVEINSHGDCTKTHEPDCEVGKLLAEQERLSWILAGVSTAVLGYLKVDEDYSGKPLDQIEEALVLREAFTLACDQVHRSVDAPDQTLNSTMCHFLEQARKNVADRVTLRRE